MADETALTELKIMKVGRTIINAQFRKLVQNVIPKPF